MPGYHRDGRAIATVALLFCRVRGNLAVLVRWPFIRRRTSALGFGQHSARERKPGTTRFQEVRSSSRTFVLEHNQSLVDDGSKGMFGRSEQVQALGEIGISMCIG